MMCGNDLLKAGLVLAIFILLLPQGINAQSQTESTGDDAVAGRFAKLLRQSEKLLQSDPETALQRAEQAHELVNKGENLHSKSIALVSIGNALMQLHRYQEARWRFHWALVMARHGEFRLPHSGALLTLGKVLVARGEYVEAQEHFLDHLDYALACGDTLLLADLFCWIGDTDLGVGLHRSAGYYYNEGLKVARKQGDVRNEIRARIGLGKTRDNLGQYAEALQSLTWGLGSARKYKQNGAIADAHLAFGDVYLHSGSYAQAREAYETSLRMYRTMGVVDGEALSLLGMGEAFFFEGSLADALRSLTEGHRISHETGRADFATRALEALSRVHSKRHDYRRAYDCLQQWATSTDSLNEKRRNMQSRAVGISWMRSLERSNELRIKEFLEQRADRLQAEFQRNTLIVGVIVFMLLAIVMYSRSRSKQRTAKKLELAYSELQRTQDRLIHAERMASLGQITAGIAHEIKNPLNFINNCASLNDELVLEILDLPEEKCAERLELLELLQKNCWIIRSHGERADKIVHTMLDHSFVRSGKPERHSVNEMITEALKLKLQSRDNGDADEELFTDLDHSVGKIPLIAPEFIRVILNLLDNAQHSVRQRAQKADSGFMPRIVVRSILAGQEACVSVKDNGTGMSEDVRRQIFEPFFTTKPTGEGTGLGLSLSWEIIVKGHNGRIEVDSTPGDGSEFRIYLPRE